MTIDTNHCWHGERKLAPTAATMCVDIYLKHETNPYKGARGLKDALDRRLQMLWTSGQLNYNDTYVDTPEASHEPPSAPSLPRPLAPLQKSSLHLPKQKSEAELAKERKEAERLRVIQEAVDTGKSKDYAVKGPETGTLDTLLNQFFVISDEEIKAAKIRSSVKSKTVTPYEYAITAKPLAIMTAVLSLYPKTEVSQALLVAQAKFPSADVFTIGEEGVDSLCSAALNAVLYYEFQRQTRAYLMMAFNYVLNSRAALGQYGIEGATNKANRR